MQRADHSFRGVLPERESVCVFVCVFVCHLETSTIRRHRPELGCWGTEDDDIEQTRLY